MLSMNYYLREWDLTMPNHIPPWSPVPLPKWPGLYPPYRDPELFHTYAASPLAMIDSITVTDANGERIFMPKPLQQFVATVVIEQQITEDDKRLVISFEVRASTLVGLKEKIVNYTEAAI